MKTPIRPRICRCIILPILIYITAVFPEAHLQDTWPIIDFPQYGLILPTCDTSLYEVLFGNGRPGQLLDIVSLSGDAAICVGKAETAGKTDALLLKTNRLGAVVWAKTYDGGRTEYFKRVMPTKDGGFLLIGSSQSFTFSAGQAWAVKTDGTGNPLWSFTLDIPNTILQQAWETSDGGFAMVANVDVTGPRAKIIVIKTGSDGQLQWMKEYYHSISAYGYCIRQAQDGNLLISGFTHDFGAGLHDGCLMKVSTTDGSFKWMKVYGSSGDDVIDDFDECTNGDLLLTMKWGRTRQATVIKTDPEGNVDWAKLYTFPGRYSRGLNLDITADDGMIVGLSDEMTGGAVMKLDTLGTPQWIHDYEVTPGSYHVQSAVKELSSHTGFVIAGYTTSPGGYGTDPYLIRTDNNGKPGTCPVKDIQVNVTALTLPTINAQWDHIDNISGWHSVTIQTHQVEMARQRQCPQCCSNTEVHIDTTVCPGTSYLLPDGRTVSEAGQYTSVLPGAHGCDSTVVTALAYWPTGETVIRDSICARQYYRLPDGRRVQTAGQYISTLRSSHGCDSVVVTELAIRDPVQWEYNDTICPGTGVTFPDGTFVNRNGDYTFTTTSPEGCDTVFTCHLLIRLPPQISIGADTCLSPGDRLTLIAPPGFLGYTWQNGSTGTSMTISGPGTYWLKVRDECTSVADSLVVTANCSPKVYLPTAFTPNGDGMNDLFRILRPQGQKLQRFTIYNRWGQVVFHTSDMSRGWDGRYGGRPQPSGTYVYVVELTDLTGHPRIYHGTVILIR